MPTVMPIFYVYEHWRPDKDVCFWVGKGHKNRAWEFRRRNFHHRNIVAKLGRLGMCVEVRMVRGELFEAEAHALERERIAFWRAAGVDLANITDGGEGVVGLKHSDKTRALLSARLKGKKNPEHSARLKGRTTAMHSSAGTSRRMPTRRRKGSQIAANN